jgi:hypothetical protein
MSEYLREQYGTGRALPLVLSLILHVHVDELTIPQCGANLAAIHPVGRPESIKVEGLIAETRYRTFPEQERLQMNGRRARFIGSPLPESGPDEENLILLLSVMGIVT